MDDSNDTSDGQFESSQELELDRIDLAEFLKSKNTAENGDSAETSSANTRSKRYLMAAAIILAAGALLAVTLAAIFAWKPALLDFSNIGKKQTDAMSPRHIRIGPIRTSVGKAGNLEITLIVECDSAQAQQHIEAHKEIIRDHLLVRLSGNDVAEIIVSRHYTQLKQILKTRMNQTLSVNAVKAVYFSDIKLY